MLINIKPDADAALRRLAVPSGHGLRIDAVYEPSCGHHVVYSLAIDEPTPSDLIGVSEPFPVFTDTKTVDFIGDTVSLNHIQNVGYVLSNDEQTLAVGLKIVEPR